MGAGLVGHSRPLGNYRNGESFCREDQLADCNPASHGEGVVLANQLPEDYFGDPCDRRDFANRMRSLVKKVTSFRASKPIKTIW
jgi:hypothetical protein